MGIADRCCVPALALALFGCSAETGPRLVASPSHASQFGYVDVTLSGDVAALGDIQSVTVGGVPAYRLRASAGALTVTVQGAPRPGAAAVEVVGSRGRSFHAGAFSYDAPVAGMPAVWAAFGASLTQGMQSAGLDEHGQTHGVAADIARQAGVYLALPIVNDGVLPPLHAGDFNADCSQKAGTGVDVNALVDSITDPETQLFDLRRARAAWALTPRNLAIGGSTVDEILHGGTGAVGLLEHIVEEPTTDPGDVLARLDVSQIDRLQALDPDVAFITDLLANDIDGAVGQSDDLRVDLITPVDQLRPELVDMMDRLGKRHGQYFIANLPSLTFVPNVAKLRAKRLAAGSDSAASFDAKLAQIEAATAGYNQALVDALAPHPNLHLVDLATRVHDIVANGVLAGGETCTAAPFGGLLSFDNLHFSDTGYAVFANLFIDELDAVLGTRIPAVDLDAVHAGDEAAPGRLRAAGFSCVPPSP